MFTDSRTGIPFGGPVENHEVYNLSSRHLYFDKTRTMKKRMPGVKIFKIHEKPLKIQNLIITRIVLSLFILPVITFFLQILDTNYLKYTPTGNFISSVKSHG